MSVPYTRELAGAVTAFLLRKAASDRSGAGQQGEFGDRGASELEAQVECFNAGRQNRWPAHWTETVNEIFKRESDPEYQQYLLLKKKYG